MQHANTAAILFAWPQCHDCPLHLFQALGGGHSRPSGCHILLNVALTPAFRFKCGEVVVFFCWQKNNNKRSVTRQAASEVFELEAMCNMPTQQQVSLHGCNAMIVHSIFLRHLAEGMLGLQGVTLNVALTPAFPFKCREVVVFFLHLFAN